ncbi:hypothetical protein BpHYR1_016716 [Brachionus plicatilis]|uniref:Uncharacterized protein n=1 Tax=Brachionus plicatilis TaxID=10195 RepID=A0A3M7QL06_BRAPC|nr:hypothetical protein BpHYR1_016716 [Brachionus plicatilis]
MDLINEKLKVKGTIRKPELFYSLKVKEFKDVFQQPNCVVIDRPIVRLQPRCYALLNKFLFKLTSKKMHFHHFLFYLLPQFEYQQVLSLFVHNFQGLESWAPKRNNFIEPFLEGQYNI